MVELSSREFQIGKCTLAREFDHGRSMGQDAIVIDHGAIHQGHSAPGRLPAIAAVNVTEDMQPRLDSEQSPEQVLTSGVFG